MDKSKNRKARYWAAVLYPESLPEGWLETIQQTGLPFALSPLHDQDKDPTGEPKKAHYHIILCYNGPVTQHNVAGKVTEPLGQPLPQDIQNVKGYYRYLTHKDNPEKYQYDEADIQTGNGFTLADYATLTISDEDKLFDELEAIIYERQITEYASLVGSLRRNQQRELLSFLRRHSLHFDRLLTSLRNSFQFDKQTGEVLYNPFTDDKELQPPKQSNVSDAADAPTECLSDTETEKQKPKN